MDKIDIEISSLKVGDTYSSVTVPSQSFELVQIINRELGKKLPEHQIKFRWKHLSDGKEFINRIEDLRRSFMFRNWLRI